MTNREIDCAIAEKLFGAKVTFLNQKSGWLIDYVADLDECNDGVYAMDMLDGYRLKYYSDDIRSAWEVVNKFDRFVLTKMDMPEHYYAKITFYFGMGSFEEYEAKAETAAIAICKVALMAINVMEEK